MTEAPAAGPGEPSAPPASSLGRFAPDPEGAALHEVHLLGLPVRLMAASREQHDGLMREFRLLALSGDFARSDPPSQLVELVAVLGEQYASSRERRDEELDAALERGDETIDQVMETPATAAVAARALQRLLDEADTFCEQAMLMTLPRPPLLRRFSDWYLNEVVEQIAGRPARPWDGPLTPDPCLTTSPSGTS